jgi:peptide-methionine (S)-S-oxide reductase
VLALNFSSISYADDEAIFAMGCFWCAAEAFTNHTTHLNLPGILSIRSGYTGGTSQNPTYLNHQNHREAIKIVFDPEKITYARLLDIFWHNIDPFDNIGQFCDKGDSYISVIYYNNNIQMKEAIESKKAIEQTLKNSVVTEIKPTKPFYDAEEYHQDYFLKNPAHYKFYRWSCGRDKRLKEIWEQN